MHQMKTFYFIFLIIFVFFVFYVRLMQTGPQVSRTSDNGFYKEFDSTANVLWHTPTSHSEWCYNCDV